MVPPVLLVVPLFVILREIGLLNTTVGLALAHTSILLPLFVWLMKGSMDAVPGDLDDAARIDGCTRPGALLRVVLPAMRNGVVVCTTFVVIASWNEFLFALMLTTSAGARTWPVGLQLLIGEFQLPWGMLSAGGVLSILPVAILFAFIQRTLVRRLSDGVLRTRSPPLWYAAISDSRGPITIPGKVASRGSEVASVLRPTAAGAGSTTCSSSGCGDR